MTYLPVPSIVLAPGGIVTDPRRPRAAMRFPSTTTVALARGGPPLPSITVAPTIAVACAERPRVTATSRGTRTLHRTRVRAHANIWGPLHLGDRRVCGVAP